MKLEWQRYLSTDERGFTPFGVRQTGWQSYEVSTSHGELPVRSMLMPYELALLHHLARDHYRGCGAIVDAGTLLGLSAHAMSRGLLANPEVSDKAKRIFSFDLFLSEGMGEHVAGADPGTGSVLDRFLQVNRDCLDCCVISPGDLLAMRWSAGPVEIVFIDVAKTWELNRWVVQHWFSCLAERAWVVQQDYIYFHQYWIALTMQAFSAYFERVEEVFGATVLFRATHRIPASELRIDLQSLPLSRKIELLDLAIGNSSASAGEVLKCGKAYCLLEHGELGEARRTLSAVIPCDSPVPARNFRGIAESNQRMVAEMLEAAESARRVTSIA
ncbi:MAG TPA: hypothetical protein VES20_22250 [Bryobacteraceae bacterium]|nr:hypothetical protein [Bryobacteraceae bacterium]